MSFFDYGEDLDPATYPDEEAPYGSVLDLPYEAGDADPQPIEYDDLPGREYDPKQDWREKQAATIKHAYGEFSESPEHEEATGG